MNSEIQLQQLGEYRIIRKLGEGGMGAVYLGEHRVNSRRMALKVLSTRHAGNPEFVSRFRREAGAASVLKHENIIAAVEAGEDNGQPFFAMDFYEGESLDQILETASILPVQRALEITKQVAQGLKFAHEHAFVHRDVKPGNILVLSGATPAKAKILDLGLSKNLDAQTSFATETGAALGTPHYISPEQARGEKNVDGRTDIYSLGATLYHLLTGQAPFHGTTAAVIMLKHLSEQLPDPKELRPGLPDNVVLVLRKMMAKAPIDRYRDCDELIADLESCMRNESPKHASASDIFASTILAPGAKQTARRRMNLHKTLWWYALTAGIGGTLLFFGIGISERRPGMSFAPHPVWYLWPTMTIILTLRSFFSLRECYRKEPFCWDGFWQIHLADLLGAAAFSGAFMAGFQMLWPASFISAGIPVSLAAGLAYVLALFVSARAGISGFGWRALAAFGIVSKVYGSLGIGALAIVAIAWFFAGKHPQTGEDIIPVFKHLFNFTDPVPTGTGIWVVGAFRTALVCLPLGLICKRIVAPKCSCE